MYKKTFRSGSGKDCQGDIAACGKDCGQRKGKVTFDAPFYIHLYVYNDEVSFQRYIGITGFDLEEFHKVFFLANWKNEVCA